MSAYFSKGGLALVLAAVVGLGNQLVPVLPPVWANLVTALIGVYAFYTHGKTVAAARAMGVKGV